jgi:hypothetical protein
MLQQGRSLLLAALVLLLVTWADISLAGEGFFRLRPKASTPAAPVDGGYGMSYGTPGPQRYPAYADGNYPWYGYGFGVPTYNWGYFGVHYRPMNLVHVGYYGDYYQWGYRRGY